MPQLDNEAHELLCNEYLVDLNQTKAYMRVYPDSKYDSARTEASKFFTNPNNRIRIRELMDERSKDTLVDAKFVVDGLNELYQRCLQAKPVEVWDYDKKAMIQTGEWQFDSHGAAKALELLGKHVAMFTEKTEVKNTGDVVIIQGAKFADKPNADTTNG